MRNLAIVENGVVINVIVAESLEGAIDVTDLVPRPGPEWTYNGGTSFSPPAPQTAQTTTRMTQLGFIQRMTAEEWGRFETFLAGSVEARFAKAKFDAARDVDVSRADVQGFTQVLRMFGVLTSDERMAALLEPISVTSEHALP